MPGLKLITSPAVEPVSLAEARLHLRLETSGSPPTHPDDALVTSLIAAARQHIDGRDGWLNRALITQTWELHLDKFPDLDDIRIPLPPLQSIVSVKYDDVNGVEQTVPAADYIVDTARRVGWVVPVTDTPWPATFDTINAVRVRFTAGYGNAGANVPAPIKAAMLLIIGHLYENREAVTVGVNAQELPMAVMALLSPFELVSFQ
jgi:uncharacterized phiE125 gp8 family phage protein